jgi:hypothetical protein
MDEIALGETSPAAMSEVTHARQPVNACGKVTVGKREQRFTEWRPFGNARRDFGAPQQIVNWLKDYSLMPAALGGHQIARRPRSTANVRVNSASTVGR